MPTFETPEPISVTVELLVGDLRVVASDRTDTVVEVLPSNPAKKADVEAAAGTRVEYASGMLLIKAPSRWLQYSFRGAGNESVDVRIDVPAGISCGRQGRRRPDPLHRSPRQLPGEDRRGRDPAR